MDCVSNGAPPENSSVSRMEVARVMSDDLELVGNDYGNVGHAFDDSDPWTHEVTIT